MSMVRGATQLSVTWGVGVGCTVEGTQARERLTHALGPLGVKGN